MGDTAGRRAQGSLESEVMATLWAAGEPLTSAQVQAGLGGSLAYNTVQTILTRLLDKALVHRCQVVRGHAYWPVKEAATAAAEQMRAALDRRGDRQAVLRQFVAGLDAADATALRAFLAAPGTE